MKTPAVPSKNLLRFLRAQSESPYFFTGSLVTCRQQDAGSRSASPKTSYRQLSTSGRRDAKQDNSYIDYLWPRHRDACKALPPPRLLPPQPTHARYASTDSRPGFFARLLRRKEAIEAKMSSDMPYNNQSYEDTSAQLFNLSRALSRNYSGADLKLRCTEFDANGSVTLVSGEFKKSELIAKYGLLPRDLRKIDSSVLPHILVRPSAILINLLHLRVLIQSDRVLVFDAYGSTDSYTQSLFMYDLEGKLRQKADPRSTSTHLPYELRALEAVLISVTSGLEAEFALVRDPVTHILSALEEDIDREKLRHLLIHSKKLGTFEQKARLVRDAIDDLLEADDDLAAMYLSEHKKRGQPRPETDHQEVEMLLESYHKICDEIVEISGNLISNIRNTEEVVKAILDANRNQLMLLEIKFSIGTLGLAGGTLIAGLYGMNLNNFIEETDWGFGSVSAVCFGLTALVCVYGMRKLRKVQKVRMWGEGPDGLGSRHTVGDRRAIGSGSNRGNWRSEALEYAAQAQAAGQRIGKLKGGGINLGGGANSGPVLWPGMDGLGMHKLNTIDEDRRSGDLDTNSDADASYDGVGKAKGPSVTIHNDFEVDAARRMAEDKARGRGHGHGHGRGPGGKWR